VYLHGILCPHYNGEASLSKPSFKVDNARTGDTELRIDNSHITMNTALDVLCLLSPNSSKKGEDVPAFKKLSIIVVMPNATRPIGAGLASFKGAGGAEAPCCASVPAMALEPWRMLTVDELSPNSTSDFDMIVNEE
jgi:hypothetical protein